MQYFKIRIKTGWWKSSFYQIHFCNKYVASQTIQFCCNLGFELIFVPVQNGLYILCRPSLWRLIFLSVVCSHGSCTAHLLFTSSSLSCKHTHSSVRHWKSTQYAWLIPSQNSGLFHLKSQALSHNSDPYSWKCSWGYWTYALNTLCETG